MKIKLFTHNDLDGVGCAILTKLVYGEVDVKYCSYNNVNEEVIAFTDSAGYLDYDKVFITDISVNEYAASLIQTIVKQPDLSHKYQLIDHHSTAKWLNKYFWANVNDFDCDIKTYRSSATSLLHSYLWAKHGITRSYLQSEEVSDFVEKVRRYDTWEWTTKYNDIEAKKLNDLLWIIGIENFVERFSKNMSIKFTEAEQLLLDNEERRINTYIITKEKQMIKTTIDGYSVGLVFAEQNQSQLGSYLANRNPKLDFIVMIDVGAGKISYRGIHDHIDLGVIANKYGGGGHAKTAGSEIDDFTKELNWTHYLKGMLPL